MSHLWIDIELESDVALTVTSATVGGHSSHGHIPGGALLGVLAARAYPGDRETAFRRFHSGALRFGPGLPVGADGGPTLPMPLALHAPKGAAESEPLYNLARGERPESIQLVQRRAGFLDGQARITLPTFRASMRTAIGAEGRAREGFLYTVSAVPAGTRFLARIDADRPQDLDAIRQALKTDPAIRLGRSRSAELGKALAHPLDSDPPPGALKTGAGTPGLALFACVSDLALRNPDTGQPSFDPVAADFGLSEGWKFSPGRSFLRTRTWSPFNGKRMRPDMERQVIVAGSVLCFEGDCEVDTDRVGAAVDAGIGCHLAEGCGRLIHEPVLLAEPRLRMPSEEAPKAPPKEAPSHEAPPGELREWLEAREAEHQAADAAFAEALKHVRTFAPSRLPAAQWGEVRRLARLHRGRDELVAALNENLIPPEDSKARGSIRQLRKCWGKRLRGEKAGETLVAAVKASDHPATMLELLAVHVVRAQRKEES